MPGTIARRRKTFGLVTVLRQTTALSVAAVAALGGIAEAKVSRIVVDKVEALKDAAGQTIPMEKLRGRAFGELDPQDPANAQIVDLKLAPRNANGKVEYVSVFELTKPTDMSKATGLLWYDLVNRGRPLRGEKGVIQPWIRSRSSRQRLARGTDPHRCQRHGTGSDRQEP